MELWNRRKVFQNVENEKKKNPKPKNKQLHRDIFFASWHWLAGRGALNKM